MAVTGQAAIDRFARVLSVSSQGDGSFLGFNPQHSGRLFGGLVAAQATVAAGRTADGMSFHSLHAYFLRPGRPDEPIRYTVESLKDGKNFRVRHVVARQGEDVIFTQSASFTRGHAGISHQAPAPPAPPPQEAEPLRAPYSRANLRFETGVELRNVEPPDSEPKSSQRFLWMRPEGRLSQDPLLHVAAFVYLSDRTLMGTGARPHRTTHTRQGGASLDHALWFHRLVPFDGWILYAMDSPAAHDSRAWNRGAMYLPDGTRILSVAQEGLLRMAPLPA